jgi:LPS sulfotransferase NodH
MNGYLMLTEGRSGSSWLSSLANSTGRLGNSSEWIDRKVLGVRLESLSAGEFFRLVLDRAKSDNDRFAVKLFPRHIYLANQLYGFDFIRRCLDEHSTRLVVLRRNDRVRQAISLARGRMTRQYRSILKPKQEPKYDFDLICRCYFFIERSYAFWQSYLDLLSLPHDLFIYEDMQHDPSPFLRAISEHLGVEPPDAAHSDLRVQRDALTEQWVARFEDDLHGSTVLAHGVQKMPIRNFKNIGRFLRREPMLPLPFSF